MNKQLSTYIQGFSVLELVIAVGVFTICMLFVFQYSQTMYRMLSDGTLISTSSQNLVRYPYGDASCYMFNPDDSKNGNVQDVNLGNLFSTSTVITRMFVFLDGAQRKIVFVGDSASTTEADIYVGRLEGDQVYIDAALDVGPGIRDAVFMPPYMFVANTSVNSHVKVFKIDTSINSTSSVIQEIQSIKINSLSQSLSMPRTLAMFGQQLVLGTEKNNAGGELFFLNLSTTTMYVSAPHREIELGGQAHHAAVFGRSLLVTTAGDPELKKISFDGLEELQYDAPLSIGNGKSILSMYPYAVLGRTLGSHELTLLDTSLTMLDSARTYGTVDALEVVHDKQSSKFLAFTANSEKELQIWFVGNNQSLSLEYSLDLPGRMNSYACADGHLYITVSIVSIQHLLIL